MKRSRYKQAGADLLLTGRVVGAEEALQLGLVARTAECAVTSALQMADQVRVSNSIPYAFLSY